MRGCRRVPGICAMAFERSESWYRESTWTLLCTVALLVVTGARRPGAATYKIRMRFQTLGSGLCIISKMHACARRDTLPGIMYVSDRSADSICVTALLFLVMKSEYMPSHCDGMDSTSPVFCVACLYMSCSRTQQNAPSWSDCATSMWWMWRYARVDRSDGRG